MAHLITGVRLLLVAPTAVAFARPEFVPPLALAAFVAVAIASDYFDGIVASRLGTASARGRLFDHTSDFLFATSGLAGAAVAGEVPAALPVLITVAFTQYVLDSYFLHRAKELRLSTLGRWNGLMYFVPLVFISLSRLAPAAGWVELLSTAATWLCYLLVLSTLASIVDRALAVRGRLPSAAPPPAPRP